jgi:hypothetical protein
MRRFRGLRKTGAGIKVIFRAVFLSVTQRSGEVREPAGFRKTSYGQALSVILSYQQTTDGIR